MGGLLGLQILDDVDAHVYAHDVPDIVCLRPTIHHLRQDHSIRSLHLMLSLFVLVHPK